MQWSLTDKIQLRLKKLNGIKRLSLNENLMHNEVKFRIPGQVHLQEQHISQTQLAIINATNNLMHNDIIKDMGCQGQVRQ